MYAFNDIYNFCRFSLPCYRFLLVGLCFYTTSCLNKTIVPCATSNNEGLIMHLQLPMNKLFKIFF